MDEDEKRSLVKHYLAAYNAFDIDGMMELIHPNIEFKNISGGEVNATASDAVEFSQLEDWRALYLVIIVHSIVIQTRTIGKSAQQNNALI